MLFLITICKISSRFRYFGTDLVSYRAIFPVSVQLNHIHPLRQNRNGAKIKSTPTPHLYHTKTLGYISSNAHKPDRPHNQRTIHDQQHISEKSVLHSFQTDNHRKRHSHSLPIYSRLYNISPDHPNQITIHPTPDKNHITLSCRSGSQYKSQSPTYSINPPIQPQPNTPHSRYRPHSHFGNLRQSGITFCITQK